MNSDRRLQMCFGFPNTWGPLVALRLVLGALEGGFFPGEISPAFHQGPTGRGAGELKKIQQLVCI